MNASEMNTVERAKRASILLELIDRLREKESWGGVTEVQKSSYMLQTMLGVPLGFHFFLYHYGPYSRELMGALNELYADELVRLSNDDSHYGPKYTVDEERGRKLMESFPEETEKYADQIEFIAETFGGKGIQWLERVCTAFYIIREFEDKKKPLDRKSRADQLRKYKPHIPDPFINQAIDEIDSILQKARKKGLIPAI